MEKNRKMKMQLSNQSSSQKIGEKSYRSSSNQFLQNEVDNPMNCSLTSNQESLFFVESKASCLEMSLECENVKANKNLEAKKNIENVINCICQMINPVGLSPACCMCFQKQHKKCISKVAENPNFICTNCIITKMDFLEECTKYYPLKVTKGYLPIYHCVSNFIYLSDEEYVKIRRNELIPKIICINLDDKLGNFHPSFPQSIEIYINEILALKLIPPKNILSERKDKVFLCKNLLFRSSNKILIKQYTSEPNYIVGFVLNYPLNIESKLNELVKETSIMTDSIKTYQDWIQSLKSMDNQMKNELQLVRKEAREIFSLECPLTSSKMKIPCRGFGCNHVSCFDLENWLKSNQTIRKFECPFCRRYPHIYKIKIDSFLSMILETLMKEQMGNITEIELCENGSFVANEVGFVYNEKSNQFIKQPNLSSLNHITKEQNENNEKNSNIKNLNFTKNTNKNKNQEECPKKFKVITPILNNSSNPKISENLKISIPLKKNENEKSLQIVKTSGTREKENNILIHNSNIHYQNSTSLIDNSFSNKIPPNNLSQIIKIKDTLIDKESRQENIRALNQSLGNLKKFQIEENKNTQMFSVGKIDCNNFKVVLDKRKFTPNEKLISPLFDKSQNNKRIKKAKRKANYNENLERKKRNKLDNKTDNSFVNLIGINETKRSCPYKNEVPKGGKKPNNIYNQGIFVKFYSNENFDQILLNKCQELIKQNLEL